MLTNFLKKKVFIVAFLTINNYNLIMAENEKVESQALSQSPEAKPVEDTAKPLYKVFGSDIELEDKDVINYYKTRMKIMVMRFLLVGRIDDKGVYNIKDEIKYDLIRINKEISDSGEDFYKASSKLINKIFHFNVKITKLDDGKAKASLYLSEFVDDFLEERFIVSHIADFVDNYDENFRTKVREVYNLLDVAVTNDELAIPNLAVLVNEEYEVNEYIGELYDIASQIYIMRMLKLLEASSDPVCHEIVKQYKQLILDKNEEGQEKFKYTSHKALLDRAIDQNGGIENLNVDKAELKSIIQEINKSVMAIDDAQKQITVEEVMKPDKEVGPFKETQAPPKAKAKAPKSKGATSSSSNGSEKRAKSGGGRSSKSGGGGSSAGNNKKKEKEVKVDHRAVLEVFKSKASDTTSANRDTNGKQQTQDRGTNGGQQGQNTSSGNGQNSQTRTSSGNGENSDEVIIVVDGATTMQSIELESGGYTTEGVEATDGEGGESTLINSGNNTAPVAQNRNSANGSSQNATQETQATQGESQERDDEFERE